MFQAKYLCGAARLPHHPRSSFPLRLRLLVPDRSLEPKHTNTLCSSLRLYGNSSPNNTLVGPVHHYIEYKTIISPALLRTCACLRLECWGSRQERPWSEGWAGLWRCGLPCPAPFPHRPLPPESGCRQTKKRGEKDRDVPLR